jgi:hypothetical protein
MAEDEIHPTDQDLDRIIQGMIAELPKMRDHRAGYEQRLYECWGKALDLFEVTFIFGGEAAAEFNKQNRPYAAKQQDVVFDVLTRIHARACQTSSAIYSLLQSGHGDDALARARTLHELHVTAKFINGHENDLAERYRLYEVVESLKASKKYQKYCVQLGVKPLDPETIPRLEELLNQYRTKFGEAFARSVYNGFYGWASETLALGKKTPTFEDIEEAVDLSFMRPYYQIASYPVHANAKGLTVSVGNIGSSKLLVAGPSNAGLADPANMALSSFYECTAFVLRYATYVNEPALKDAVENAHFADKVLKRLVNETHNAFLECHHQLVEDELRIQAEEQMGKYEA